MAFVTDVSAGVVRIQSPLGLTKKRRSERDGIGIGTGVAIAGASAAFLFVLAGTFAAIHGSSVSVGNKFDTIALVSPKNRVHLDNTQTARVFHPEKTGRLYPVMASRVINHVPRDYQVPPRAAVASVNVPVSSAIQQMAELPAPTADPAPAANQQTPVQVASVDQTEQRFGLVMQSPKFEAPLPMARPEGWPKSDATAAAKDSSPKRALAYATPDVNDGSDGLPRRPAAAPRLQAGVAIYDISAHTIFLPDGKRMEVHSGLGRYKDNPKYTKVKAKGPTPPNIYTLSMREKLFHGVPALRLTPADWSKMHGRNGILAHTYLRRGRPGQSAGCLAFKHYYKFLDYYKRGLVKKIIVVDRLGDAPSGGHKTLASLFSSNS